MVRARKKGLSDDEDELEDDLEGKEMEVDASVET